MFLKVFEVIFVFKFIESFKFGLVIGVGSGVVVEVCVVNFFFLVVNVRV